MTIRRLPHAVVAVATLVAPLAAFAQPAGGGTVTTAPLATAPAMGMPLLALLAVVLTGVAAYFLRRAAGRAIAVLGFVAALSALAAHAIPLMIMVQGAQCSMRTTQMFMPMYRNTLVSHCANPIQIVSIQLGMACGMDTLGALPDGLGFCRVGQVLANGEDCFLPTCPG